jgi:rRNA maturation endonuclease Nob1
MFCQNCGAEFEEDDVFCSYCGANIESNIKPSVDAEARKRLCPKCGTELKGGEKFCGFCGADIESIEGVKAGKRFCHECGTELREEEKFCSSCGARISEHDIEKAGAGARFGSHSLGDAANNIQINKWKILGYVVVTWVGFYILAGILVELEPNFTIRDGQVVVWGLMSLFMGIYLATKFKKWLELVWGVVLCFSCAMPGGLFICIGYFARAYVKLEKARCGNIMDRGGTI